MSQVPGKTSEFRLRREGSGRGLVTRKNHHVIRVLGLSARENSGEGREEGLEIEFNHVANDPINRTCAMKPPIKTLDTKLSGTFRFVNRLMCHKSDTPDSMGGRQSSSVFVALLYLALCMLSFGWSLFVSLIIIINYSFKCRRFLSSMSQSSKLLNLR